MAIEVAASMPGIQVVEQSTATPQGFAKAALYDVKAVPRFSLTENARLLARRLQSRRFGKRYDHEFFFLFPVLKNHIMKIFT